MFVFKYFVLFFITLVPLFSHQSRENYINIEIEQKQIVLTCDIETDNFSKVIALDDNGNNIVSWRELSANEDAVMALILKNLVLMQGDESVPLEVYTTEVHRRDDQSYIRVVLRAPLSKKQLLILHYQLFFDLDPLQRVFVVITEEEKKRSMLLTPAQRQLAVYGKEVSLWEEFRTFFREGVGHIWTGYDHLLFLLMLTLPLFLEKNGSGQQGRSKSVFVDIIKIVTLFSLAHSLTLGAAFFDIARVNVKMIESLITLSIIITALFNVFNYMPRRIYLLVFSFGLLHGFGFANALRELALGNAHIFLSLLGFNLGVEVGQIVLVILVIPLLYLLARYQGYYRLSMKLLSGVTVALAMYWLVSILGI